MICLIQIFHTPGSLNTNTRPSGENRVSLCPTGVKAVGGDDALLYAGAPAGVATSSKQCNCASAGPADALPCADVPPATTVTGNRLDAKAKNTALLIVPFLS